MKRIVVLAFAFLFICFLGRNVLAYDNHSYPYENNPCLVNDQCPFYDPNGFCESHCTSYAAYILSSYVTDFDNSYQGVSWGNGGHWNDAAGNISGQDDIIVDSYPLPGDIAYWEYDWTGNPSITYDDYGHVAWVEKVNFDGNSNPVSVDITEYNYSTQCGFDQRTVSIEDISGFIHILAYEEGVTSLYYLDCSEQSNLCTEQTKEEWDLIASKVWNDYRCTNCESDYSSDYISAIAGSLGGMGGGPGGETESTDTADEDPPDFIVNKVWLETTTGTEQYTYRKDQEIKMKAQLKNIGDGGVSGDIETRFYLSDGYKEDSHNEWVRVGTDTTQGSNLDPSETHTETEGLQLWTYSDIKPGKVYNIVACVDRIADQNNGDGDYDEEHESNNCSTETIFTVRNPSPTAAQIRAILLIINDTPW